MTVPSRLILLLGVALLATNGCATRKRTAAQTPQPARVLLVGTVALVNSDSGFVLIDQGQQAAPTSGALLKTYSGGTESAVLVASDVRKRPFIIADIKSGAPQKGDRVFIPTIIPAPVTPEVVTPAVATPSSVLPEEELPQLSAGEADQ
jgi:hypothetical protein